MGKIYGLTNTEMEIMEFFWQNHSKLSFKELLVHFNEIAEKGWKKQTLSTYLTNLHKGGLIGIDTTKKNYTYYPLNTKEEHIHKWTKCLVKKSFNGSISSFVSAYIGGTKITKLETEKLKKLIDEAWED